MGYNHCRGTAQGYLTIILYVDKKLTTEEAKKLANEIIALDDMENNIFESIYENLDSDIKTIKQAELDDIEFDGDQTLINLSVRIEGPVSASVSNYSETSATRYSPEEVDFDITKISHDWNEYTKIDSAEYLIDVVFPKYKYIENINKIIDVEAYASIDAEDFEIDIWD